MDATETFIHEVSITKEAMEAIAQIGRISGKQRVLLGAIPDLIP